MTERVTFARDSSRLIRTWRRAVREAAAPFWEQWALVDLRAADAERHARHLAAIAALDQGCAAQQPEDIAAAGGALVSSWQEVTAFMAQRAAAAR